MKLLYQLGQPESPATFKLQGFPEEAAVVLALEREYGNQSALQRQFVIYNMFDELIFSGSVDTAGKVAILKPEDRRDETKYKKD